MIGFCLPCQADIQSATSRVPTCSQCAFPLTPASYGKHTQTWRDGSWVPAIERPAGYVYTPKVHDTPERKAKPSRPTDTVLGRRTTTAKPRKRQQQTTSKRTGPVMAQPCAHCQAPFFPYPPRRGGRTAAYCSERCRKALHRKRSAELEATG